MVNSKVAAGFGRDWIISLHTFASCLANRVHLNLGPPVKQQLFSPHVAASCAESIAVFVDSQATCPQAQQHCGRPYYVKLNRSAQTRPSHQK